MWYKISRLGLAAPPGEIVYGINRTYIVYNQYMWFYKRNQALL